MFDADEKVTRMPVNDTTTNVRILYDFLKLSARPDTSGQAAYDHLLGSLAIALGSRETVN